MTDIEILRAYIERVREYLDGAEKALTAKVGTEAAKISAASIVLGAAHCCFADLTKHLSECGGSIQQTVTRIQATRCGCDGGCECGMEHSHAGATD